MALQLCVKTNRGQCCTSHFSNADVLSPLNQYLMLVTSSDPLRQFPAPPRDAVSHLIQ